MFITCIYLHRITKEVNVHFFLHTERDGQAYNAVDKKNVVDAKPKETICWTDELNNVHVFWNCIK